MKFLIATILYSMSFIANAYHEFNVCVDKYQMAYGQKLVAFQGPNITKWIKSGECSGYRHDIHAFGNIFLHTNTWIMPIALNFDDTKNLKKYTIQINNINRGEECNKLPKLRWLTVNGKIIDDINNRVHVDIYHKACSLG
jgi:hypothetical protein